MGGVLKEPVFAARERVKTENDAAADKKAGDRIYVKQERVQ
jgi:hypothetical protein